MGHVENKREVFDYHVTFEPKFYTERARIHYEAETYSYSVPGQELTDKQQQKPPTFEDINIEDAYEEGDRNDFGPSAHSQDVTFREPTVDASGTKPTEQLQLKNQVQLIQLQPNHKPPNGNSLPRHHHNLRKQRTYLKRRTRLLLLLS